MPWSDDTERFVKLALAPARVQFVDLDWPRHWATVFMPTDQYELARGENAANQTLASELTGWTIDVAAVDTVQPDLQQAGVHLGSSAVRHPHERTSRRSGPAPFGFRPA